MSQSPSAQIAVEVPSARKEELLSLAYLQVLVYGLSDLSLRPLSSAIGTSPRVLLYLFGSKEGLVGSLLARARADELLAIEAIRADTSKSSLYNVARQLWAWLSSPGHRGLLCLWVEAYSRSLVTTTGPWADFAVSTVHDWLDLLSEYQPPPSGRQSSKRATAERTMVLALLRGAMLDVIATGDFERVNRAVTMHFDLLEDHVR